MSQQLDPTIADLKPNPRNPRLITPEQSAMLGKALAEFGDLGGICLNRTTGQLVGGHQRVGDFKTDPEARVEITERLEVPDRTGTVAVGWVWAHGTRYSYREVEWDKARETLAGIAANQHGGDFDPMMLAEELRAVEAELGAELTQQLSGFTKEELEPFLRPPPAPTAAEARRTLAERFGVPPFSVLDARQGYWQDRKRAWLALGIQSELGRGSTPSTSARAAEGDIPTYRHTDRSATRQRGNAATRQRGNLKSGGDAKRHSPKALARWQSASSLRLQRQAARRRSREASSMKSTGTLGATPPQRT